MIVIAMLITSIIEAWTYLLLGAGIGLLFVLYNHHMSMGKKIAVVLLLSILTFLVATASIFNRTLESYNENGNFVYIQNPKIIEISQQTRIP